MKKLFFATMLIFVGIVARANDPSTWTNDELKAWYEKKTWAKGCPYEPDTSVDKRKFAISYFKYQKAWDATFAFFKNHDLQNLELKRYDIKGDKVYANVSEALTRDYDKTNCEFHLKVIDVQFTVRGTEGVAASQQLGSTIVRPYDATKDVMLIKPASEKMVASTPGRFFIFFPGEPHRPNMTAGAEKSMIKKVVVKIKME